MMILLSKLKSNWVLIAILIIASFLRLYQLDNYPKPANQDELNNIYDSYSILKTGSDRWNRNNPILLRGFGNEGYPTALYSWMSIPFMKIAGEPNLFYGRLLSALLGILSVLLAYLFCKINFDKRSALIAALILCFSPWHIVYSRVAIESSILPAFFIILIMYLWQKMRIQNYSFQSIILLGIIIGISTNAYTASRITALLFSFIVFFELVLNKEIYSKLNKLAVLTLSVIIGASAQLYSFIMERNLFMGRGEGVLIDFFPLKDFLLKFISNVFKNLDIDYLFFDFPLHNNITVSRFFPFLSILYLISIGIMCYAFYTKKFKKYNIVFISLIISIIPAALTYNNPISIRSSGLSIVIPILCSITFYIIFQFKKTINFYYVLIAVFILNVFYFSTYYKIYKESDGLQDPDKQHLLYLNAIELNKYNDDSTLVIIDYFGNQPYMYYLFFNKIEPNKFQKSVKVVNTNENFDFLYRMGNYFFIDVKSFHNRNKLKETYSKSKKIYISYNQKINDLYLLGSTNWMNDTCYFYSNKKNLLHN